MRPNIDIIFDFIDRLRKLTVDYERARAALLEEAKKAGIGRLQGLYDLTDFGDDDSAPKDDRPRSGQDDAP